MQKKTYCSPKKEQAKEYCVYRKQRTLKPEQKPILYTKGQTLMTSTVEKSSHMFIAMICKLCLLFQLLLLKSSTVSYRTPHKNMLLQSVHKTYGCLLRPQFKESWNYIRRNGSCKFWSAGSNKNQYWITRSGLRKEKKKSRKFPFVVVMTYMQLKSKVSWQFTKINVTIHERPLSAVYLVLNFTRGNDTLGWIQTTGQVENNPTCAAFPTGDLGSSPQLLYRGLE